MQCYHAYYTYINIRCIDVVALTFREVWEWYKRDEMIIIYKGTVYKIILAYTVTHKCRLEHMNSHGVIFLNLFRGLLVSAFPKRTPLPSSPDARDYNKMRK